MDNTRRLNQNQYCGKDSDRPGKSNPGDMYVAYDTGRTYVYDQDGTVNLTGSSAAMAFAPDTDVSPSSPGVPTPAEIKTWNDALANPYLGQMIYYTGSDTSTDAITHLFYVDGDAAVISMDAPLTGDVVTSGRVATLQNLSGDVTSVARVTTISPGAVDIAMLSATGTPDGTTFLRGDNTWTVPAGAGDVSKVGTPANTEIGTWTGDGTLGRSANLTYDGSNFLIAVGDLGITGTRVNKGWFDDLEVTNTIVGDINGNAATVTTITGLAPDTATTAAAQPNITSVGTLTTLTVDDITINGNTISSSGASSLAITPTGGQAILLDGTISIDAGVVTGATSITSTDFVGDLTGQADTVATIAGLAPDTATTAAAQPNITSLGTLTTLTVDDITINANGISSTGASTMDISPLAGQSLTLDGTIDIDAGVITGATSITSTAFVGTLSTAAQPNITSVGTLTTLTVDDITINGNSIVSAGASSLEITPTAGQNITFDGTVTLDAGVITGATSITSTSFVGDLTGNADTVTTITGLAPDTATTAAAQPNITSLGTLTTLTVDDITINGNSITSAGASVMDISPLAGQALTLDGTINIDAGVVTGATSITSTAFVGDLTGNADTVTTNANLSGDVTSVGNVTTISNDAVTYAKMQNAASNNVFLGNNSGAGSVIEELTATEATALLDLATSGLQGVVELATTGEANAGTDTSRVMSVDTFAASDFGTVSETIQVYNIATDVDTAAAGISAFAVPDHLDGYDLVDARATVHTLGTSTGAETIAVQLQRKRDAATANMLSAAISLEKTEYSIADGVVDGSNDDLAAGDLIIPIVTNNLDTTDAKGLWVVLSFRKP